MISTWAEHLRQNVRMTVDEKQVFDKAWELHAGDSEPVVRHFLSIQRSMYLHGLASAVAPLRISVDTKLDKLPSPLHSSTAGFVARQYEKIQAAINDLEDISSVSEK